MRFGGRKENRKQPWLRAEGFAVAAPVPVPVASTLQLYETAQHPRSHIDMDIASLEKFAQPRRIFERNQGNATAASSLVPYYVLPEITALASRTASLALVTP